MNYMYVVSVPNRNSPPAILLREAFREKGKVKNRTLANLSSWPTARIDLLRRLLKGELDTTQFAEPVAGPIFGTLFALKSIAAKLGVTKALGNNRDGKLALFLVLARVAHQGSRLSAVRWAQNHAVAETLGLHDFDEDDLYATLDHVCRRQEAIEKSLWKTYLKKHGAPPTLFLYDVTSTYLEGEHNALGRFGYNRDGKRGKLQIVIGLLADTHGEPLAVRVFYGNTADPATVLTQIEIMTQKFKVADVIFVGDRGMVKSVGKKALAEAGLRYISALTDPQIRTLLQNKVIQLELFHHEVCEVEAANVRYVLRRNPDEAKRIQHRFDDKLAVFRSKLTARNERVEKSSRANPQVGLRALREWLRRHKMHAAIQLELKGRAIEYQVDATAEKYSLELAGCYVIATDVAKDKLDTRAIHDSYMALQKVERDFRTMKTGLLEIRPVFVQKETRTRGHVFCCMLALKVSRELERQLTSVFGTTDKDPRAIRVAEALTILGRLPLLTYSVGGKTLLTRLPRPDALQEKVLAALEISLPTS